jgi:hypothetical protein
MLPDYSGVMNLEGIGREGKRGAIFVENILI